MVCKLQNGDILKLIGARWAALGADGNADGNAMGLRYEEEATADKVRYAAEWKQWQEDHPDQAAAMEAQA